jgi:zinc protease
MDNGTLEAMAGKRNVPALVAAMLQRGAGNLSRQQIADRLEELKATLRIQGSFNQLIVNFQTQRDKLPELLGLIAEILQHPTFPEAELEQLKSQILAGIDMQRHEPQAVAQNALIRYGNPYPRSDIRYVPSFDEEVEITKAMTVADLKAFHDDFYGADHAQLALVGDFDPAVIEPMLGKLFGDWKARIPSAHVPEPYHLLPATAQQFETPDKASAVYFARLNLPVKAGDPDIAPLVLANYILGGGGMKSRIVDRLRQKDGISYGAGSRLSEANYDANSTLSFSAIYAPQNLAKLKTGMADVLAAFLKDGVTEQELSDAKSALLQQGVIERAQDAELASQLAFHLELGRTMAFTEEQEARIKAATVKQVDEVIRKYLDLGHLAQMYAGDFAKAQSAAQ